MRRSLLEGLKNLRQMGRRLVKSQGNLKLNIQTWFPLNGQYVVPQLLHSALTPPGHGALSIVFPSLPPPLIVAGRVRW